MIRPPDINLARRPFRNNTAYYAVYAACAALLAAATAYNVWSFTSSGEELEKLRADVAFVNDRYMKLYQDVDSIKKEVAGLDLSIINTKSSFADGLIMSRFFSWSKLFDNLEELIPPEVKIQRIAPAITTKRIEISLTGMARTPEAFLEFEANLAGSLFFSNVYPVREDKQESQNNELKFALVMDYIPSGKDTLEGGAAETAQAASGRAPADAPASGAQAPSVTEPGPAAAGAQAAVPPAQGSQAPAPIEASVAGTQPATGGAPADGAQPVTVTTPGAAPAPPAGSQAVQVPAPHVPAQPPAGPPAPQPVAQETDPVSTETDFSKLSDDEFIKKFGAQEFVRARVIPRRAAKAAGKRGPAAAAPAPAPDPNAQVKP